MSLMAQLQNWLSGYLPSWIAYIASFLVGAVAIIAFVMTMVIVFVYMERRIIGRFQIRLGPNRVGPEGIFQLFADAIKLLTKEDIVPAAGDCMLHFIAPVLAFFPAIMVFAVVPFADKATFAGIDVGILYVVAVSSLSVVGIYMGGWASNNKYAMISALRAVAQAVSYELPVAISAVGVVLAVGSMSLTKIVEGQNIPFFLLQPLGFFVFLLGSMAEANRSPFDLLEAESEIVTGYNMEYSGMKFGMFYLAEYAHAVAVSSIITTLFLGGWQGPVLPAFLWFVIKIVLVFFVFIWIRSTMPRLRIDQLMAFAWKALLPMALVNLCLVAAEQVWFSGVFPWILVAANFAFTAALIFFWSRLMVLGGGRVEV
jgi:NADH-quinone oxidoreductase subunit H